MQITQAPQTTPAATPVGDFKAAVSLAALLQRVDGQPQGIGAAQYRQLVLQLSQLLDNLPAGDQLQQLLHAFPAAAVVYENSRYSLAGLCRAPLEQSLRSEQSARAAIHKARAFPT
jgi:hypothetical protein